ncbi:MAG: BspA family leucine-rich repeat surface protein, partial [Treponema sp.]|uniref:BspA family leucine-rich repeat surface protein n=1 Tax=Treponema sp. TaxID=166 RepID=UPI002A90F4F9
SLDLSKFDTSNVTYMSCMFSGCSALTSLDLSKFDTSDVTDMVEMFAGCGNLTTIYVKEGTDWSSSTNLSGSTNMFKNCEKLVGGAETKYSEENPQDKTYARVDGGTAAPGYFTVKHVVVKY